MRREIVSSYLQRLLLLLFARTNGVRLNKFGAIFELSKQLSFSDSCEEALVEVQ